MRSTFRFGILFVLLALLRPAQAAAPIGALVVDMVGFDSDEGQALAAVFITGKGFPDDGKRAVAKEKSVIKDRRARVVFENIPAGEVAVSVLHDRNMDFKMNTGLFGIPKEGYGASRDAHNTFGPPSWEDARFLLRSGARVQLTIHLRY
jgi:uncharacterized protein (DUF2141 family)